MSELWNKSWAKVMIFMGSLLLITLIVSFVYWGIAFPIILVPSAFFFGIRWNKFRWLYASWLIVASLDILIVLAIKYSKYWEGLTSVKPADPDFQPLRSQYGWTMLVISIVMNLIQGGIIFLWIWYSQKKVMEQQTTLQERLATEQRIFQQQINESNTFLQQQIAKEQREFEENLEKDRIVREQTEVLADFYRDFSVLCLQHNLRTSAKDDEVRNQAHLLVKITLARLLPEGKADIITALYDEKFIVEKEPIVSLVDVDLQNIDLSSKKLKAINLTASKLRNAKFNKTNLEDSILEETDLENADFQNAILDNAFLITAFLKEDQVKDKAASVRGAKFPWN